MLFKNEQILDFISYINLIYKKLINHHHYMTCSDANTIWLENVMEYGINKKLEQIKQQIKE
jgi:hypothetical protein